MTGDAAAVASTSGFVLRGRAWTVAAGVLVMQIGAGLPVPLYPYYQDRWGLSAQHISVLFVSLIAGIIAALLPAGRLIAWGVPSAALVAGSAMGGVSALTFAHADAYGGLVVAGLLQGIAIGLFSGVGPSVMNHPDLPGGARTVGALLTVANAVGLAVGPIASGVLNDVAPAPHRLVFWIQAAVCAALLVAVLRVTRSRPAVAGRAGPTQPGRWRLTRAGTGMFALAALGGFSGFAIGGLYSSQGSLAAHELLDVDSSTLLGLVVTTLFAANAIAGPVAMRSAPQRAAPLGLTCAAAGLVLVAVSVGTGSAVGFFLATVITGAGQGVSIAASIAAAATAGQRAGWAGSVSTLFLVCYVGTALPAFTAGTVASAISLRFAWTTFCVAIASLCSVLAVLTLRTTTPPESP